MAYLIDFVLHIDSHLVTIVNTFGNWTYLILFAIIFIETGAVIMPFLPGDSLLFAACAMAANPNYNLNIWFFVILFLLAPFLGDSLNFFIGHKVGKSLTKNSFFGRFIKEDHLKKRKHSLKNTAEWPSRWHVSCRSSARCHRLFSEVPVESTRLFCRTALPA